MLHSRVIPFVVLVACVLGATHVLAEGTNETPAKSSGPVTLTMWLGTWYQDQLPLIAEEYKKENPNVTLKVELVPINGYIDRVLTAVIGGNPPDIVDLNDVMIASMIGKDLLQPWDDDIKDLDVADFAAGIWSAGLRDGHVYALPNRNGAGVYFINKTMYENAGLSFPDPDWTYANLLDNAKKITIPGQQYGVGIAASLGDTGNVMNSFAPVLWAFGGDFLDKTNTRCVLDEPGAINGITFWTELYTKHKVVPEGSVNYTITRDVVPMFISNKVAMYPSTSGQFSNFATLKDLKWGVVMMPQKWNRAAGWSFTVPVGAMHPQEARDFALWFVRPENLGRLAVREPARRSATNVPPWNTEEFKPIFASAPHSRLLPTIPEWSDIQNMIITELQKILQGTQSPEHGARVMASQANAILKK